MCWGRKEQRAGKASQRQRQPLKLRSKELARTTTARASRGPGRGQGRESMEEERGGKEERRERKKERKKRRGEASGAEGRSQSTDAKAEVWRCRLHPDDSYSWAVSSSSSQSHKVRPGAGARSPSK